MEAFEYARMTAAVWLWERVGVGWQRMVAVGTVGPCRAAFPSPLRCLTAPLPLTCSPGPRVP